MSTDPLQRLRAADPLDGNLPAGLGGPPVLEGESLRGRGRDLALVTPNALLLGTVLLHGFDHWFLQERGVGDLSFEVMLGGVVLTLTAALSLLIALRDRRRAPLVALFSGPWVSVNVVVGHFIPYWGEFSDPYADAGVGWISYAAAGAVVVAGAGLAAMAAAKLHRAPRAAP